MMKGPIRWQIMSRFRGKGGGGSRVSCARGRTQNLRLFPEKLHDFFFGCEVNLRISSLFFLAFGAPKISAKAPVAPPPLATPLISAIIKSQNIQISTESFKVE